MLRKIKIPKIIIPILIFAIILNLLRLFLFGTNSFLYIIWNIFLASVPFVVSLLVSSNINKDNFYNPFFILGFLIWILFLPNAPYVITDFIHLGEVRSVPIMYDIILLFVSSISAMFFGLFSMENMENVFLRKFSTKITQRIMFFVILFSSFGIYLGRTLRFNSWDFFFNYQALFHSIFEIFIKPSRHINAYFYTIIFFFVIYTSFSSFKNRNIKI